MDMKTSKISIRIQTVLYTSVDKHEDKHDKSFTVCIRCLERQYTIDMFMKVVTSIGVWCGQPASVVLWLSYTPRVWKTRGFGPHNRVKLSEDYIKHYNAIYSTIWGILLVECLYSLWLKFYVVLTGSVGPKVYCY